MVRFIQKALVAGVLALLILALSLGSGGALAAGPTGYTWVWQNPVGTGELLFSTSAASATAVWSVGAYGAILYWNGTTLTKQASGTTNNLYSVYAQDATHVWAVGEKGTILFYNGTTWAPQGTGVTTYDLMGVTAAATNRVWAVGGYDGFHNAVILYYNGTTWTVQLSQATGGFTDVYAFNANNVWAVNIWTWYYNGTTWTKVNDGATHAPYQISGYSATNLWAVDWDGTILNSVNSGTTWNAAPSPPNTGTSYGVYWPSSISALDATHIYAVGWGGSIALYNGAAWAAQNSGTTKDLYDVDIFAAASIFAGGDTKFIAYNSPTWNGLSGGTTSQLNAVHSRDANNVWTVGTNVATFGNIQSTNSGGNIWSTQASGTTDTLNGVDYFDSTHVWTAGQNYVRFWNGAAWSSQVDGTVDTITSTVAVQTQPRTAGINTATNKIYVANTGSNNVSVINGATDTVTGTIVVGSSPRGVCVNPTTNRIYVGNQGGNSVTVIDGATDTMVTTIPVGTQPYRLSVNPTTNKIYVANWGSNNVSVINGATNTVSATIALGNNTGPLATAVNPTTNKVYVANTTGNSASIINGATDTLTKTIAVGNGPYGVDVNATTNKIYMVNSGSASVSVINGTTDTVASTVAVGTTPRGVAANPVTNRIYIANYGTNNISVMDGSTDAVTATIAGGTQPFGANANPVTNKIYISNYGGNNVSVLNGPDRSYFCVAAAATNRVWVGSDYGRVRYYNGTTWALQIPDTQFSGAYYGIAAPDTTHVWAVGANGEIVYWNGATWAKQTSGTTNTLRAVTAINSTTAWATGDGGVICYTSNGGTNWTVQTSGTTQNLLGISAADATHVWAVGAGGIILFYNGTSWAAQTSPTTNNLRAVFAYDANNAWAVGDNGTIIFADPPYIKACAPGWANPGDTVDVEVIGGYTNFQASAPTLSFGAGVNVVPGSVNVVDNTHILAQVQVDAGAALGPRDVNATTAGETPIPLAGGFVVGATPTIASISKASAPRGWTGDVEITGSQTSFSPASHATFGSGVTVNGVTCRDIDRVTANITVTATAAPGPRSVNVTTGSETPAPLADAFTVATPPGVAGVSPGAGPIGTQVTVTGTGFGPDRWAGWSGGRYSQVSFDGIPATDYSVWSDTSITCRVPGGAGAGPVTVDTANGPSNTDVKFTPTSPASPAWYLAEGSTAWGFNTEITVMNPNSTAVTVRPTFMTPAGRSVKPDITLPANSIHTISPGTDYDLMSDFSTKIECLDGKSIAVDRTMYWLGQGAAAPEGHTSIGVTSPAQTWYLAEGSSAWGFESWLLIQNPGATDANCRLTYMIQGGVPVTVDKTVPANSRRSFNMADDIGAADASVKVSSDVAVIAERSMYRDNRREGSNSIGTTALSPDYYLAEGTTAWGFTTYVLVQNPNPTPTDVTLTYMTPSGPAPQPPITIPANSRQTINANDAVPGTDLSVRVHGSQPIVAERAMYWDSGTGQACHDSIGLDAPHRVFYLPGGQSGYGFERWFETWTLVQNPNDVDVQVKVSYLTDNGAHNASFNATIPANSRMTFNMADKIKDERAGVVVECTTASRKVMAERSTYFGAASNIRGAGTNTIGGFSD
jgi:YVTN family beta-propeller protein